MVDEPPPILDCARALEYAAVDESVKFTGRGALYVGARKLDAVYMPRLAICQNMGANPETFLFHCDEKWTVLGTDAYSSIEAARQSAEKAYEGISDKWVKS